MFHNKYGHQLNNYKEGTNYVSDEQIIEVFSLAYLWEKFVAIKLVLFKAVWWVSFEEWYAYQQIHNNPTNKDLKQSQNYEAVSTIYGFVRQFKYLHGHVSGQTDFLLAIGSPRVVSSGPELHVYIILTIVEFFVSLEDAIFKFL